jgi:GTPase
MAFHSGFVSIVGLPNAGKSTLYNRLVGEKLSVVNPKAQTTRHRILGIVNRENCQIVYSDTPGLVRKISNKMHEHMVGFVYESLEDADVLVYLANPGETEFPEAIQKRIAHSKAVVIVALNKIDLSEQQAIENEIGNWKKMAGVKAVVPVSALHGFNIEALEKEIVSHLPEHPAFFPEDQLTDKTERFFVNEILRGQILNNYNKEIPYSIEVITTDFKEEPDIIRIRAEIYAERDSQKAILIGEGGRALKRTGTAARKELESFFGKKIFLETHVKVRQEWRDDDRFLRQFGYKKD